MAIIQLNYLDWKMLDAKGQYEILTEYGTPVWVMEPLKGGRLVELSEEAAGILKAAAPERSIASWGMRFLQGLPNVQVVMSGMSIIGQVEDNLKTFEKPEPLSEKEKKILLRAADLYHKELGVSFQSSSFTNFLREPSMELMLKDGHSSRISCFVNFPILCWIAFLTIFTAGSFVSTIINKQIASSTLTRVVIAR